MLQPMSDIQALLSVDAGKTPPGTVAFFARDPDAPKRRAMAVMAVLMFAIAVTGLFASFPKIAIALVALAGIGFFLHALPPEEDPGQARMKKPTLVITPTGMIVRDGSGLRSWSFDDLRDVRPYLHGRQIGLLVVERNGSRHFVDTLSFERGEKVRELIGVRLKPREV
jgi:hypothetical protein